MKKLISIIIAVLAVTALFVSCDFFNNIKAELENFSGSVKGLALYYDKAADQNKGIIVTLIGAGIVLEPNKIPLDVAPLEKTTADNGSFSFSHVAPGSYIVIAKDPNGEYQPANVVIEVAQGGVAVDVGTLTLTKAVKHVVIFRDNGSEWENTSAIGDILTAELGMTEGAGIHQFEYKESAEFATYSPSLGDLVVIGGDQTTAFYDAYTAQKGKFDTFVENGGTMFWVACDGGWNGGDFTSTLPGGTTWSDKYENYNNIVYSDHPITKNFPSQLYGNWASHGGFDNLASLSLVNLMTYVKETERGLPTYIEYRTGQGRVLATTAPLEYYVTHGPTDTPAGFTISYKDLFKLMLVRSLRYIMGQPVSEALQ